GALDSIAAFVVAVGPAMVASFPDRRPARRREIRPLDLAIVAIGPARQDVLPLVIDDPVRRLLHGAFLIVALRQARVLLVVECGLAVRPEVGLLGAVPALVVAAGKAVVALLPECRFA